MSDSSTPDRLASSGDTAAPEKAALWEDFVDIFFNPSSVFARREQGSIMVPLIVVSLLMGIIAVFSLDSMSLIIEAETRRSMPPGVEITPEQREMMGRMQGIFGAVGAFLGPPIMILLVGLMLWLAGKVVDSRQTLHAALVVSAYAFVPRVIEAVLVAVQARILDPALLDGAYRVRLSPARFLDPDTASPIMIALLSRIDLFVIWVTVLLAIGLAVTGRISHGRAAIAAIIVWVIGGLVPLFGALRQG